MGKNTDYLPMDIYVQGFEMMYKVKVNATEAKSSDKRLSPDDSGHWVYPPRNSGSGKQ